MAIFLLVCLAYAAAFPWDHNILGGKVSVSAPGNKDLFPMIAIRPKNPGPWRLIKKARYDDPVPVLTETIPSSARKAKALGCFAAIRPLGASSVIFAT